MTGQEGIYRRVNHEMLAALDGGIVPWRRPWSLSGPLLQCNGVSRHVYRGVIVFTRDARGRAIRDRLAHPTAWDRLYHRRPITASANWSLKRRWGDRLWRHGLWRQRAEVAFRVLAYNCNVVNRAWIRFELKGIPRRELRPGAQEG